ncbi:sulfurtransferase [Paenibacillaceae bacterium]|nr:sulfurtransferase [Paenibacillaceae bacterium]
MANQAIVSVSWLSERIQDEKVVVLDVRFSPKDADYGKQAYDRGHLPGASFVNFKADLADKPQQHGGRSPLPSPEKLAALFGGLGIDQDSIVVVYEDKNGPAATRLWWVLSYLGVEQVYVLDGGYAAWTGAGLPVTAEADAPVRRELVPAPKGDWLASVQDVRQAIASGSATLIDSRDRKQFTGEEAPQDPVAGHIPGARHYFWKDALDEEESWLPQSELAERFAALPKQGEYIVYCGSGITATPNVLALREAGYTNVKLYAGSWSDWISYEENPIAVGEE